jgi:hypothetical protein
MLNKPDYIKIAEQILCADAPLVEFPYTKLLSSCINGMLQFFAEPQEVKDAWTIDYNKTGKPDDGYRRSRHKPGTTADSKEIMHVRARDIQIWKERDVPKFDDYLFWIAKTLDLLSFGLEHIVFPVARALDEHRKKSGISPTIEQNLRQGASLHVIQICIIRSSFSGNRAFSNRPLRPIGTKRTAC